MPRTRRNAVIQRKTTETRITGALEVDGTGTTDIKTGIGFLDHMLTLFAFHGLFDLKIRAKGDLEVDKHHTNEDIAICLGKAFKEALGSCEGIRRFGSAEVPMDQARSKVTIDIGGRYGYSGLTFIGASAQPNLSSLYTESGSERYSLEDGNGFLDTFAQNAQLNLHVEVLAGGDAHHILEAVFKACGIALDQATQIDPRRKGIPSTKGII